MMARAYQDFEILVGPPTPAGYALSARGPGGDARGTLVLPINDGFTVRLSSLERLDRDAQALEYLGVQLFTMLFDGQVRDVFRASQGAIADGDSLRLVLNIAGDASAIAQLPWELLWDPDAGPLALAGIPI